jgi:aminopeptidase N
MDSRRNIRSKYWFPCLEDPQVKFPREIKVIVSENDLIVLSNGELAQKDGNTWTWTEPNPTPSYLTSVVIGKFAQEHQQYTREYKHNGNKQTGAVAFPYYIIGHQKCPKKMLC